MKLYTGLDLRLFDGAAAGAGAQGGGLAAGNAGAPEAGANGGARSELPAGKPETQTGSDTAQAREAEFDRLINGDYRDLYEARMQKAINTRFKQVKALEAQAEKLNGLSPVLELLGEKYGVDGSDIEALTNAIQEDDSYYEDEAMRKGMTVEQLKEVKRLERENAALKRTADEQQRRAEFEQRFAVWARQAEEMKGVYPNFDFNRECASETGERFMSLLRSGVDVRTAYEVVHKDEIIGGAMQYTAQTVQQKVVNDIRARGMRPAENGAGGSGAAILKTDVSKLTKKDRDEIARRVMRGERVTFS